MNALSQKTLNHAALLEELKRAPYRGYAYSYPHKNAYHPFLQPKPLSDIWRKADFEDIALYVHIPFCEMRCGFCNLFTAANLGEDIVESYLRALEREIDAIAGITGHLTPKSLTLGGGTPTYLSAKQLNRLFDLLGTQLVGPGQNISIISETSPKTAQPDRLGILADRGVGRISIGVQSFIESETKALGRPQASSELRRALDEIRQWPFKILNIDLIYGMAEQNAESFLFSLREAMRWSPDEMFLYPLYVRPLTGLDGRAENWDTHRLALYRAGRDFLLAQGYRQISMRMFRKSGPGPAGSGDGEAGQPEQHLLGLGCGARSRAPDVHYSTDYAVRRQAVLPIIQDYCQRSSTDFQSANYGIELSRDEQMRRFIIKTILNADGLNLRLFEKRFDQSPIQLFPELSQLCEAGLMSMTEDHIRPTDEAFQYADAIGPLFYSQAIATRMREYRLK